MKIKMTRNRILLAAIVLLILTAAWFYGNESFDDYRGKAELPEQTQVGEKGATESGEDELPDELPAGPKTFSGGSETKEEPGPAAPPAAKAADGDPDPQSSPATTTETNPETGDGQQQNTVLPGDETASLPGEKPEPARHQDLPTDPDSLLTCRLSVSCEAIFDNMNSFNKDKLEMLPEDGIIFPSQDVIFYDGESIFNVLQREMKKAKIHLEFTMAPLFNSYYVEGINNIYEFDCGELSGWMCKVNDCFLSYGCSNYLLKNGDIVAWIYTCDLGRDIGAEGPEGIGQ